MSDPLDDLGALWRDPAGDAPLPGADLDAQDAETRAAVEWMRRAWRAEQADAAPPIPWELRRRAARRGRTPLRRVALPLGLAAAAALAVWIGTSIAGSEGGSLRSEPRTHATDLADAVPEPSVVDPIPLTPDPIAARPLTFAPDSFVPRDDGIEMVTGKVRVILLDPDAR